MYKPRYKVGADAKVVEQLKLINAIWGSGNRVHMGLTIACSLLHNFNRLLATEQVEDHPFNRVLSVVYKQLSAWYLVTFRVIMSNWLEI